MLQFGNFMENFTFFFFPSFFGGSGQSQGEAFKVQFGTGRLPQSITENNQ